jgi:crossover junction endodeoxyribonuclease RuvC
MLVLGIDPGIAITGYGLVREDGGGDAEMVAYGAIRTPAEDELPARLQQVYKQIREVVEQYKPDSAAIEKLLFGKNVTTAMAVGQARGVTVLALADCHIPMTEYTCVEGANAGHGAPAAWFR